MTFSTHKRRSHSNSINLFSLSLSLSPFFLSFSLWLHFSTFFLLCFVCPSASRFSWSLLASEVAKQPPFPISTSLWTPSTCHHLLPSSSALHHQTNCEQTKTTHHPKLHSTPLHGYLLDFVVLGLCLCVCVFLWGFVSLNLIPHPLWSSSHRLLVCGTVSLECFFVLSLCIHTTHFLFLHQYTQPTWSRVADLLWKFLLVPNCFIAFFWFCFQMFDHLLAFLFCSQFRRFCAWHASFSSCCCGRKTTEVWIWWSVLNSWTQHHSD